MYASATLFNTNFTDSCVRLHYLHWPVNPTKTSSLCLFIYAVLRITVHHTPFVHFMHNRTSIITTSLQIVFLVLLLQMLPISYCSIQLNYSSDSFISFCSHLFRRKMVLLRLLTHPAHVCTFYRCTWTYMPHINIFIVTSILSQSINHVRP